MPTMRVRIPGEDIWDEDWEEFAEQHPEIEADDEGAVDNWIWTGHPNGNPVPFEFANGRVFFWGVDSHIQKFANEIADCLGAVAIPDD